MTLRSPIILVIFSLLLAAHPSAAANKAAETKELKRIERELREKKKKLKSADRKERSILSELERLDREGQGLGRELAEQRNKLREAEAAHAELARASEGVRRDADRLKPAFAARLRAIYKMKRSGGYALAILSAADAASFGRRARALASVAEGDRRLLADYQAAFSRLESTRREAEEREAEIRESASAVEAKQRSLGEQRRKKTALLASVKRRKGVYEETLRELEESSKRLWSMVREAERERAKASKKPALESKASGGAPLPWPVNGQVLTRFGSQRHPQFGTVMFRRGIEIDVKAGDEVRAVAAGEVVHADWVKGYGQLVIIDHGAGLYTLYGHLSSFRANKNERVARGQAIGAAGDTGSLAGPRLYFELRRNGEAEDPLRWLAKR